MLAEASRVTLVLRRGPSSADAPLLGEPRPALEWARAEWKPAEAKAPARAAQPVERAPKQEEAKAYSKAPPEQGVSYKTNTV